MTKLSTAHDFTKGVSVDAISVTRLGALLNFGNLFKAIGKN